MSYINNIRYKSRVLNAVLVFLAMLIFYIIGTFLVCGWAAIIICGLVAGNTGIVYAVVMIGVFATYMACISTNESDKRAKIMMRRIAWRAEQDQIRSIQT